MLKLDLSVWIFFGWMKIKMRNFFHVSSCWMRILEWEKMYEREFVMFIIRMEGKSFLRQRGHFRISMMEVRVLSTNCCLWWNELPWGSFQSWGRWYEQQHKRFSCNFKTQKNIFCDFFFVILTLIKNFYKLNCARGIKTAVNNLNNLKFKTQKRLHDVDAHDNQIMQNSLCARNYKSTWRKCS